MAKIVASRNRQKSNSEIAGRIWKFPDRFPTRVHLVGDAFWLLSFLPRHERSVVRKSFVGQYIEYPIRVSERKFFGRTITNHLLPARVFDSTICPPKVRAKFLVREIFEASVV